MITFRSIYFDASPREGRILDIFEAAPHTRPHVSLFFVHGGGWKAGTRAVFHQIALAYSSLGFDCASTDYRLGGVTIEDQVSDVRQGLSLFVEDLRQRNRPTDIVLLGSSAGAHLALLSALQPDPPCAVAGLCVQAAPFTFEPWTDIFPAIWADMQTIVGESYPSPLYREASPIHYVQPGMPPVFALHSQNEHMFPLSLTEQFIDKAKACGARAEYKIYEATEHGFFYALDRRQQKEAFDDILTFIASLQ